MYEYLIQLKKTLRTKEEKKSSFFSFLYLMTIFPFIYISIALITSFFKYGFNLYNILVTFLFVGLSVYVAPRIIKKAQKIDNVLMQKKEDKLLWLKEHDTDENLYRLELIHLIHEGIKDVGDVEKATVALEKKKISRDMLDIVHYHITHENSLYKSFRRLLSFASNYTDYSTKKLETQLKKEIDDYLDAYMKEKISPTMQKILVQKINQNKKASLSLGL